MTNKYCNLVPTNLIRDEFGKIGDGFASVEIDKNAQDDRAQGHISGAADKHAAENITYAGTAGGTEVETAINSLKSDIDNVAAGGTEHDALVTASLVDADGVDFGPGGLGTYLDGRLTKWEQSALSDKAKTTTQLNSLPTQNFIKSNNQDFYSVSRGTNLKKLGVVLTKGSTDAWDDFLVESANVFFDKNTQKYCMNYVGYKNDGSGLASFAAIGLAWSWKPEGPYVKDLANPVLKGTNVTGDVDEGGTTGGTIWFENGIYYMYYIALKARSYEGAVMGIGLATSTDLHNWTRHGLVITPQGTGWRGNAVYHSSVVKVGNVYYMFFNASNSSGVETIGYATSTDLLSWVVDDVHSPLISPVVGAWDSYITGDPCVYFTDNTWYMAYFGLHSEDDTARDGLAWTTAEEFPLNWRKSVITLSPSDSFDNKYAHKPCILINNRDHYHFYTAQNTSGMGSKCIALAVDESTYANIISTNVSYKTLTFTGTVTSILANGTYLNLDGLFNHIAEGKNSYFISLEAFTTNTASCNFTICAKNPSSFIREIEGVQTGTVQYGYYNSAFKWLQINADESVLARVDASSGFPYTATVKVIIAIQN